MARKKTVPTDESLSPKITTSERTFDSVVVAHSTTLEIPLDCIDLGFNVRTVFDKEDMDDLIDSVRLHGVLEPPIVCAYDDGGDNVNGRYLLLAGERRYRAARSADLNSITCQVMPALTDQQKIEVMLSENLSRKDLLPIEEARGFKRMMDLGISQKDICERLHRSQPYVSNRIRLLDLPDTIQAQLNYGVFTPAHCLKILTYKDEPLYPQICDHFFNMDHAADLKVDRMDDEVRKCILETEGHEQFYHDLSDLYYSVMREKDCYSCDRRKFGFCTDSICYDAAKILSDQRRAEFCKDDPERVHVFTDYMRPLKPVHCEGCSNLRDTSAGIACTDYVCQRERRDALLKCRNGIVSDSLNDIFSKVSDLINDDLLDGKTDILEVLFDVVSDHYSGNLVKRLVKKAKGFKHSSLSSLSALLTALLILESANRYNSDIATLDLKRLGSFLEKYSLDVTLPDTDVPDDFFAEQNLRFAEDPEGVSE